VLYHACNEYAEATRAAVGQLARSFSPCAAATQNDGTTMDSWTVGAWYMHRLAPTVSAKMANSQKGFAATSIGVHESQQRAALLPCSVQHCSTSTDLQVVIYASFIPHTPCLRSHMASSLITSRARSSASRKFEPRQLSMIATGSDAAALKRQLIKLCDGTR
jgi:hypothetical protein